MLVARDSVRKKIADVKSSIGNTITVTPTGAQGFQGGGEPLTIDELSKIGSLANVTGVTETLSDRLTTENTNLASAIEPGTLGTRRAGDSGVGFMVSPESGSRAFSEGPTGQVTRTFTPPVIVTGQYDLGPVGLWRQRGDTDKRDDDRCRQRRR